MKKGILLILLGMALHAHGQDFIPLWEEGKMPNSKGIAMTDSIENGRWRRVAVPGYYHFRPSKEENKGAAVMICTPGGYGHHTYDIAGFQLAKWFNTIGVSAFVLINRLPHSPDLIDRATGPLTDARRLMKIIRVHAEEWGIDPLRVGVMGSSAGGHLAAMLGTCEEDRTHVADDGYETARTDPDFMILVSPVITMESEYTHKGSVRNLLGENPSPEQIYWASCEKHVMPGFTPPAFMVHADNDPAVSSWNSVLFYSALKRAGIPASLHIFPYGGHSIALRNNPGSTQQWTALCEAWLYEMEMIK
jgi:Esterase/lipase